MHHMLCQTFQCSGLILTNIHITEDQLTGSPIAEYPIKCNSVSAEIIVMKYHKIKQAHTSLFLYKYPNSSKDIFLNELVKAVKNHSDLQQEIVTIMGDFNIDYNTNDYFFTQLQNHLGQLFRQVITKYTTNYNSVLDFIIQTLLVILRVVFWNLTSVTINLFL